MQKIHPAGKKAFITMNKDDLLEHLREQYNEGDETHPHLEALLKANPPKRKHESIQWVIDALTPLPGLKSIRVAPSRTHDPHKMDASRADEDISWCPGCECKWNMYEGRVWKSRDIKLWKEGVCPGCDFPVK